MISDQLKKVILAKLGLDDFAMDDSTLANEVTGWDSLTHVGVIIEIEREFNIRLHSLEVMRLKNLGELQMLVDRRTAEKSV